MKNLVASAIVALLTVFAVNAGDCCCDARDTMQAETPCCPAPSNDADEPCECGTPCVSNSVVPPDDLTKSAPAPPPVVVISPDQETPVPICCTRAAHEIVPSGAPPPDVLHVRLARLQVWRN